MLIRPIEQTDIAAVARLLHALAREFIVHEASVEEACTFLRENDEDSLRGFIERGYAYHVALAGGEIAGFVAVRERSHLYHLFVDKRWQRQGLARRLWDVARSAALAAGNGGTFTVNSSNLAVPVYESFGFVRTAPMQCVRGVRFNPMLLTLPVSRALGSAHYGIVSAAPHFAFAATGCLPSRAVRARLPAR
ncbi:MAG: GNAT family N-acetyltransferase [Massilia sp.]